MSFVFTPIFSTKDLEQFMEFVLKPPDVALIEALPQRSDAWLIARKLRLTASNFGAAVGISAFCSPEDLLLQLLFGGFTGNEATRYGTENEPVACAQYLRDLIATFGSNAPTHQESGLTVSTQWPWMGASPDGIMHCNTAALHSNSIPVRNQPPGRDCTLMGLESTTFSETDGPMTVSAVSWPNQAHRFLLEIKCPFRKRLYSSIPDYYFAQIQGSMQILDLPYCHFYVWTPYGSSLECFPRNDQYWTEFLFPRLRLFYFNRFLPLAFLQQRGLLFGCNKPAGFKHTGLSLMPQGCSAKYVQFVYDFFSIKNL